MMDVAGTLPVLRLPLLLAAAMSCATSSAESGTPTVAVVVQHALDAVVRVDDYTCTSTKQEKIDGKMLPLETFVLKQRKTPDCVYLKWVEEPYKKRETIYCPAKYGDKIRVHEGSGITGWFGALSIDPDGTFARRGNRHSIREAGIFHVLKEVGDHYARLSRGPEQALGERKTTEASVQDQPSYCFSFDERDSRTEVCMHRTLALPTRVQTFQGTADLVESYTWADYHLNVGLADRDFDVGNPAYGF